MFSVTRTAEVAQDPDRVWKVWSDFENWNAWTELNLVFFKIRHKIQWVGGAAGAGNHVRVEFHSVKVSEAVMREWDPPRRLSLVTVVPREDPHYWDVALTLNPLPSGGTRVDFSTNMQVPDIGPAGALFPTRWFVETKIDAIIQRAAAML